MNRTNRSSMQGSCAHRKLTAWLGLLAIWLAVVMPMVSQSVRGAHALGLENALCVEDASTHPGPVAPSHRHHDSHSGWQACGYCSLLSLHMPVPGVVAQVAIDERQAPPAIASRVAAIHLPPQHTPAAPRAPPRAFA